jgi:hypothetical protein
MTTRNDLPGWPHYVFWLHDNDFEDDRIPESAVTLADLDLNGTLELVVNGLRSYANTPTFYNTDLLVYGRMAADGLVRRCRPPGPVC